MSFKTITVKSRVYQQLLAMKRKNESFSDLFERLGKNNIELLQNLRGCTEFTNKKQLLKDIKDKRKEHRYGWTYMIIIDTDVLIEIFDKHSSLGGKAFEKLMEAGEDIALSSLTLHEVTFGLRKYGKKPVPALEKLEIIPFSKEDALLSAILECDYEKKGLSRIDSMIAASTINRKAKLYTFNQRHFKSISRLQLF